MNRFNHEMSNNLDVLFGPYFGTMQHQTDKVYVLWCASQGFHVLDSEKQYLNGSYAKVANNLHRQFKRKANNVMGWVNMGMAQLPDECKNYKN